MNKYSKRDDVKKLRHLAWGAKLESILGEWKNTNEKSGHISHVEITEDNGDFYMKAYGVDLNQGETIPWEKVKCEMFSSDIHSKEVGGLNGHIDFGFMEISMAALLKYGILVIQTYNTFKDGSDRSNYFLREFFRK